MSGPGALGLHCADCCCCCSSSCSSWMGDRGCNHRSGPAARFLWGHGDQAGGGWGSGRGSLAGTGCGGGGGGDRAAGPGGSRERAGGEEASLRETLILGTSTKTTAIHLYTPRRVCLY